MSIMQSVSEIEVCFCMGYMFHLSCGRRLADIKNLRMGLNLIVGKKTFSAQDVVVPQASYLQD